jgi:hypothetical protein
MHPQLRVFPDLTSAIIFTQYGSTIASEPPNASVLVVPSKAFKKNEVPVSFAFDHRQWC